MLKTLLRHFMLRGGVFMPFRNDDPVEKVLFDFRGSRRTRDRLHCILICLMCCMYRIVTTCSCQCRAYSRPSRHFLVASYHARSLIKVSIPWSACDNERRATMFALPSVVRQRLRSRWPRKIFIDVSIKRAPLVLQKHQPWTTFPDKLDLISM